MDKFLEGEKYVAGGDSVSIADIFMMSSMSSIIVGGSDEPTKENHNCFGKFWFF